MTQTSAPKFAGLNAVDRRLAGIREITSTMLYIHPVDGTSITQGVTAKDLVEAVRKLRTLGRTDRWGYALGQWVTMIEESPDNLVWAVLQGSIGAGHAAL